MSGSAKIAERLVRLALLLALGLSLVGAPAPVSAQVDAPATGATTTAEVSAGPEGTLVHWGVVGGDVGAARAAAANLPTTYYNGYELPMQLEALALPEGMAATVDLRQLADAVLPEGIDPAAPLLPPVLDWTPEPGILESQAPALPTAPVFVLREGDIRGQHYVVVAVSPIYQDQGTVKIASRIEALIPNAVPLDDFAQLDAPQINAASTEDLSAIPVNTAAQQQSLRIEVTNPGIQEVLYSAIGGVPTYLNLTNNGQPVAVEKKADRFRFYVPTIGDRWNRTSVYWLTLTPGSLMPDLRGNGLAGDPGVAYERGVWVDNRVYESVYPGADADRWFHADMKVSPGTAPTQAPVATATIAGLLPAAGATTFSVQSTGYILPPVSRCQAGEQGYQMEFSVTAGGGATETLLGTWNPAPGCSLEAASLVTATTSLVPQTIQLRFLPNPDYQTGIKLERLFWERPATLDFTGMPAGGVEFYTKAGRHAHTFAGLPASWQLYDVTVPERPEPVVAGGGGSYVFNQWGRAPDSKYIIADLGRLQQPAVRANSPVTFAGVKAADALYVGPSMFADELAPLITLRSQQGYAPIFVDIEQVFDVYGFGYVSPTALRNFLRQETDWQNTARRIAVTLVGDGTYDPYNYEGKGNPNLVPAYMDDVDLYIQEAPCDQCYAQLNGDDPKTGDTVPNGQSRLTDWFASDIWLGRFPVRNEQELTAVVSKLVKYETEGSDGDLWRSRAVFLADNYIRSVDAENYAQVDEAGDFAEYSDAIVDILPNDGQANRIYYDPAPERRIAVDDQGVPQRVPGRALFYTEPQTTMQPWRIKDAVAAYNTAVSTISAGAGLVVYNGHANHWQFASTDQKSTVTWLLYVNDADGLANVDRPFIGLSMTCYTSQFAKPAIRGTLDELMFLRPQAGAAAVWGPTGLTVVHGHDLLQRGFMQRLWSQPAMSQTLGQLTEAGYTELLLKGACCQDALMTFVLLGDPLTKARVAANQGIYLPAVKK